MDRTQPPLTTTHYMKVWWLVRKSSSYICVQVIALPTNHCTVHDCMVINGKQCHLFDWTGMHKACSPLTTTHLHEAVVNDIRCYSEGVAHCERSTAYSIFSQVNLDKQNSISTNHLVHQYVVVSEKELHVLSCICEPWSLLALVHIICGTKLLQDMYYV